MSIKFNIQMFEVDRLTSKISVHEGLNGGTAQNESDELIFTKHPIV